MPIVLWYSSSRAIPGTPERALFPPARTSRHTAAKGPSAKNPHQLRDSGEASKTGEGWRHVSIVEVNASRLTGFHRQHVAPASVA
jgi:hypothetical protein